MMPVWIPLTVLTGIAAWTDVRSRLIPNALSWIAVGWGGALLVFHGLPWTHVLWAGGTWIVYDLSATWRPGSVGYGDVKWASVIMGFLGGAGLLVLAMGHLGVFVGGTWDWCRHRRHTRWRDSQGPWAPGALAGMLLLGMLTGSWR